MSHLRLPGLGVRKDGGPRRSRALERSCLTSDSDAQLALVVALDPKLCDVLVSLTLVAGVDLVGHAQDLSGDLSGSPR